jgi:ABC-type branched-subunit amino acid transport system substrate-binding protein
MALNFTRPQARRIFILGLGAAALSLASCQTGRAPVRPGPIVEPPPLVTAQNMVAVIVPLTGGDGPVGTSISNAAKLALADTGEKSIKITVYDSTIPGGAGAATQRAIADGNRLILGPLLAEDVRAAAPVARKAGVPVIAFSNDAGVASDGVYIMGFTPDQSIGRVVSYARSKGSSRFAALVPTGLYGQRAAQAMIGAVRKSGGVVTGIQSYDRSKAALSMAARRLNARGDVDAVLIGDNGRMAAMAAPLLKVGPRKLGTELWATDKALGKTASLRGAWYAAAPDAQFDRLVTRYRARYGRTPYRLASLGYDAVLLAVRSARNWPLGRAFPAKSLIDKDGFGGVDGAFRFSRDGVAERLLEVRQVTPVGTTTVSPAATKF